MSSRQSTVHGIVNQNEKPEPDQVLQDIADYVHNYEITSPLAVCAPLFSSGRIPSFLPLLDICLEFLMELRYYG
jgi:hypothetical protein